MITILILLFFSHSNNKCKNKKCSPNGTCDNSTGKCDCKIGFIGFDCSTEYKLGDSVSTISTRGGINGCITKFYDNNNVDICTGPVKDKTCLNSSTADINSIVKIDDIQIKCSETTNCKNEPKSKVCSDSSYPNNKNFTTEKDCINYFGDSSNNKWGTCIKVKDLFGEENWILGCIIDSDCPGKDRKCINVKKENKPVGKLCSCDLVSDCSYKNQSSPTCENISLGYGTLSCSDI